MGQSKKKANQRRQGENEEVSAIPSWSEFCPDLLRCVFKRLNFMDLNRTKSVCSSWHFASRGCKPKQNQIPWLILFPRKEEGNTDNNNSCCVLFVPEDKDNVYKTRDLGVDFVQSSCLATYGSWLLMVDYLCKNLYILNPLTGERIDLPNTKKLMFKPLLETLFWIDNITKDYLVVWKTRVCTLFTKKGVSKWHEFPHVEWFDENVYNHKNQKLYVFGHNFTVKIWDFSGDKPREDGFLDCGRFNYDVFGYWKNFLRETKISLAVTISGDVLIVACSKVEDSKTWYFRIFKANHKWDRIDSLGDEALILDMGVTVVAKDVQGIKRNSIYFSGIYHVKDDPKHIFVFDLATENIEPLPQCVFSSTQFSDARWFFPGFNG